MTQEPIYRDILKFVKTLRLENGYSEQNYKRYHSYTTSMLPNLRKVVAPHHRNYSVPFVYKQGEENVIFRDELAQLISVEAERAIACAGEYLVLAYNSGLIRHRRRAMQRYSRATERYFVLYGLSQHKASQNVYCQSFVLYSYSLGSLASENDDFFDSILHFSRALNVLYYCIIDTSTRQYFEQEISYRLNHSIYIATVFADGDYAVLQQIQDLQADASDLPKAPEKARYGPRLEIWDFSVETPPGKAGRVLSRLIEAKRAVLELNLADEVQYLLDYYIYQAQLAFESKDFHFTPFFASCVRGGQKFAAVRPQAIVRAFKRVSAQISALSEVANCARQFSERSGAVSGVSAAAEVFGARLARLRVEMAGVSALHAALSFVSARFQFKRFNFVRALEAAGSCGAGGAGAIQAAAGARGGFDAVVAALLQCRMAASANCSVPAGQLLLQAGALLKRGLGSCGQPTPWQKAVLDLCALPYVLKGIELAANVVQLRAEAKPVLPDQQASYFAFLGTVLPNPVYFDAISELISVEDLFE